MNCGALLQNAIDGVRRLFKFGPTLSLMNLWNYRGEAQMHLSRMPSIPCIVRPITIRGNIIKVTALQSGGLSELPSGNVLY